MALFRIQTSWPWQCYILSRILYLKDQQAASPLPPVLTQSLCRWLKILTISMLCKHLLHFFLFEKLVGMHGQDWKFDDSQRNAHHMDSCRDGGLPLYLLLLSVHCWKVPCPQSKHTLPWGMSENCTAFFSSSPESSSCLIDGRINLCGHDARAVYFCGPGLIGGQEVTEAVLKVIVPYSWLSFSFFSPPTSNWTYSPCNIMSLGIKQAEFRGDFHPYLISIDCFPVTPRQKLLLRLF